MPSSLPFRLARTAVFAVVCLSLGMVAHSLAGGSVPGPAMVAGFFVAAGGAYPLAGRERGPRAILALLGGLQLVLHVMFSLSHAVSPAAGAAHAAHASAGLAPDLGMLVAHGWAVGLTALWLARGEAALWGLLRRLATRLVTVLLPVPATPFVELPHAEPPVLRSAILRHAVSGRGPPAVIGIR
ncbi:MFS transporter [Nonomuraea harbinensis]|uniref:MFS transporter n=1 Tax=Nonomuraea harbinensis TaxID=1286938 RepID=A0ABW1C2T8_9ACTN|nr:MFS transporter [Nonomuraea harbinensis]